jgi:hypothetical protein
MYNLDLLLCRLRIFLDLPVKEILDLQDRQELKVSKERQGQPEPKELIVMSRDLQDRQELKVSKVLLDRQELKELIVLLLDLQVRLDQLEVEGQLVQPEIWV